ncbi:hypothetical protein [Sneathiella chinensis]|uniref:Uncharacterized protein n=1 Tax=Sneathiella chinensis TaxID=349750 RepID=A0ABQ5U1U3_9PROT|nr:hypothetical protein [Sneathiella chinensis]GLQ05813.1 hypothetical protein GCM10007924_10340 [Sneathiella chinensis]
MPNRRPHTPTMARYYLDKYGDGAVQKLEMDAAFWERENNLRQRNQLLRLRDEISLLLEFGDAL